MIKKELGVFLVVGGLTVCIDLLTYTLLIQIFTLHIWASKALAFIAGTIFAYFANKYWTFNHVSAGQRILQFYGVYIFTLGLNVAVNEAVILVLNKTQTAIYLGFIVATASSAIMNFIGMKFYVFKASSVGEK